MVYLTSQTSDVGYLPSTNYLVCLTQKFGYLVQNLLQELSSEITFCGSDKAIHSLHKPDQLIVWEEV